MFEELYEQESDLEDLDKFEKDLVLNEIKALS
jgi:hypothetical protein